ncbi:hypothetical protein FHR23_000868 [Stakelama sediminis]|uniref:Uncharacterized protein n=2 Tax=Stakelama sediminis TaxID=463200 RepID=A0A840YW65_9SPHN|nr:hypothetical protein [Stakelama sediminis]
MRFDVGRRPRWLRWLHRIGYVTTALILAEILLVTVVAGREWYRHRQERAKLIEQTRTHDSPWALNDDPYFREEARPLLSVMPSLADLHGNGLRFISMPALRGVRYGVVLWLPQPNAKQANGIFVMADKQQDGAVTHQRAFFMPARDFRALMHRIDILTDGWAGDADGICLDGNPVAFERIRGTKITSGAGNCSSHYDRLKKLLYQAVQRFAPGKDLPGGPNWYPPDESQ